MKTLLIWLAALVVGWAAFIGYGFWQLEQFSVEIVAIQGNCFIGLAWADVPGWRHVWVHFIPFVAIHCRWEVL